MPTTAALAAAYIGTHVHQRKRLEVPIKYHGRVMPVLWYMDQPFREIRAALHGLRIQSKGILVRDDDTPALLGLDKESHLLLLGPAPMPLSDLAASIAASSSAASPVPVLYGGSGKSTLGVADESENGDGDTGVDDGDAAALGEVMDKLAVDDVVAAPALDRSPSTQITIVRMYNGDMVEMVCTLKESVGSLKARLAVCGILSVP